MISHEDALRAGPELPRLILDQRKAELTRAGFDGLDKTFEGMGLPIVVIPDLTHGASQDIRRRLVLLNATRNVIEHNRSIVNRDFLDRVRDSTYAVGDRITITLTELGDALRAVEQASDDLNRRAVAKFRVGDPNPPG
jgi:hypothetical protein